MIWSKEDVDDFIKYVLPPGHVIKGYCGGRHSFIGVLALAITPQDGSEVLLLEALRKKYPEGVETYMPEAERMANELAS